MRKFCDAETRNEFADFLKISRSQLSYVLFVKHPHSYYKTFEIPKKSGGTRVINAPYGELKFIQEQLNKRLAEYQKYIWEVKGVRPAISHGFEKGKSIITNAKIATVYKGNIIKNLIMDCQSYTKYRPNETTGGIFVSWRRKEELPTGA